MFAFVRDASLGSSRLVSLLRPRRNGAAATVPATVPAAPEPAPPAQAGRTLIPGVDRVALVAVFGLPADDVARIVDSLQAEAGASGVPPVFLTEDPDFSVFRARRAWFEYLPPPHKGVAVAPDLDWHLYRARRLSLLCRKWPVVRVLGMGAYASSVLAEWAAEMAEDERVREVLALGNEAEAAHG